MVYVPEGSHALLRWDGSEPDPEKKSRIVGWYIDGIMISYTDTLSVNPQSLGGDIRPYILSCAIEASDSDDEELYPDGEDDIDYHYDKKFHNNCVSFKVPPQSTHVFRAGNGAQAYGAQDSL